MMGRDPSFHRRLLASASFIAAIAAMNAPVRSQTLPAGGRVASGSASISQSGSTLTINQTSARTIINWNAYSLGAGGTVTYAQPGASSATLNRVTGSAPSTIAGRINANGQVYIVNPNGIAITSSGAVNVGGGFVASTLGIADSDFNDGHIRFQGAGASAPVSNAGTISVGAGGFAGLIGGAVSNSGTIDVPLGKIGLGSGEQATLDPSGDGFLQVAVPTSAKTADGKALVDVSGKVRAAGGTVTLTAATAANAVRAAVNLSGYASASSVHTSGGAVILGGGPGGDVAVSGRASASGRSHGGSVAITGAHVALTGARISATGKTGAGGSVSATASRAVTVAGTTVEASGATKGGAVAIGGNARGAGPLPNAGTVAIDPASALHADATAAGDGGSVTVWSQGYTGFHGRITALGGPQGGNGGAVEVSSHGVLDYRGRPRRSRPWARRGRCCSIPTKS